jgi:hypothetical protein
LLSEKIRISYSYSTAALCSPENEAERDAFTTAYLFGLRVDSRRRTKRWSVNETDLKDKLYPASTSLSPVLDNKFL